jgi:hypothetical protein
LYRSALTTAPPRAPNDLGTYTDDSEHILEGHVGKEDEERSVDVHNAVLVQLLAEVNNTDHC